MSGDRDSERDQKVGQPTDLAPSTDPSDWAQQTTSRPLPKELLDAMKHPDMPAVVLDAITRRSTPAPGDVEESPKLSAEDDTARYMLSAVRRESEDSLAFAYVVGAAMIAAVLGWLSFGLLGR